MLPLIISIDHIGDQQDQVVAAKQTHPNEGVGERTRLMTTQAEGDGGGERKNEHHT